MERYAKDGVINKNWLAKRISVEEGLKVQVNIAQIREVMRVTFGVLRTFSDDQIVALVRKK
jgi:hypothetical protein